MNSTEMDDNENILDFQKMNFSQFTTPFATLPANAVNQFAAAKLVQNITTANGQVVGLVSGGDGGVHYLRPVEGCTQFTTQNQQNNQTQLPQAHGYITLPITMPGAKPGDAQQTVHIQILNPNPPALQQQQPKFQMGQMQIPIQNFHHQDTTVLTVAYSPQEGEILQNHNTGEAMTIVAAIQPQDLPLLAQVQQQQHAQMSNQTQTPKSDDSNSEMDNRIVNIKTEPVWQNTVTTQTGADFSEYFTRVPQSLPVNLQQFLKFNDVNVKKESQDDTSTSSSLVESLQIITPEITITQDAGSTMSPIEGVVGGNGKVKKKRKYKKKPPKPKKPKPGQVHIATALDGTALYCCPECHMAYPEKENLEQHLTVHKIERRFICDICGAGLKRKEHLERHKSGHNPDRPYTCSVCMKGFKRKEHLNLHFVIHSGAKTEICGECGKGFYRKDHLRKHAKSHLTKRLKEEMAQAAANFAATNNLNTTDSDQNTTQESILNIKQEPDMQENTSESTTICLPEVTIHIPTSDNQTLPVQIQLPQLVTTSAADGTTNTVVLSSSDVRQSMIQHQQQQQNHHHQQQHQQQ